MTAAPPPTMWRWMYSIREAARGSDPGGCWLRKAGSQRHPPGPAGPPAALPLTPLQQPEPGLAGRAGDCRRWQPRFRPVLTRIRPNLHHGGGGKKCRAGSTWRGLNWRWEEKMGLGERQREFSRETCALRARDPAAGCPREPGRGAAGPESRAVGAHCPPVLPPPCCPPLPCLCLAAPDPPCPPGAVRRHACRGGIGIVACGGRRHTHPGAARRCRDLGGLRHRSPHHHHHTTRR